MHARVYIGNYKDIGNNIPCIITRVHKGFFHLAGILFSLCVHAFGKVN